MADLVIANARIVLPDGVTKGAVRVRNGAIEDVSAGTNVPPGAIDAEGDLLIPGLVELHTDNLERHIEPRPGVDRPHSAAILAHDGELASVGITTVFDAVRVGSIPDSKARYTEYARALVDELLDIRASGVLRISHFIHLRAEICSETLIDELARFTPEDRVGMVSLMDHTPGQRQFRDVSKLKQYVAKKRGFSDAEFIEYIADLKELRDRVGDAHETATVKEAARLGAVLASHDDTTEAQVAVSAGHGVAMAEFPTTLEAATACKARGIAVIMGAPNLVRGGSHSGNVAARTLAEAGALDILSSDYVPASLVMGAMMLADLWDDMPRGIATVTANPARAVGLDDRGAIRPGARGDLVRLRRAPDGTPALRGVWVRGMQVG
jgi:alpha-D-ribose 1-methylphosphonate 5-triphosphate diphosphatase